MLTFHWTHFLLLFEIVLSYITNIGVKWQKNHRRASFIFGWYLRGEFYIKLSFYRVCINPFDSQHLLPPAGQSKVLQCYGVTNSAWKLQSLSCIGQICFASLWAYLCIRVCFSLSVLLKSILESWWYIYSCLFVCQLCCGCVTMLGFSVHEHRHKWADYSTVKQRLLLYRIWYFNIMISFESLHNVPVTEMSRCLYFPYG